MRLSENAHLLRYPHPSSLRRTSMYASFLGISEALHMDIFHQPLRNRFFDSLNVDPQTFADILFGRPTSPVQEQWRAGLAEQNLRIASQHEFHAWPV